MTVIGVVGDTKWNPAERSLGRRTGGDDSADPANDSGSEPGPRHQRVEPMTRIAGNSVWQRRLWGILLGVFAALALTLAAIGLYGVMSYMVTLQTREIGIRMAIGAPAQRVLALVLGKGMALVTIGGALGLVAAFAASRFLTSLLFGLSASDPITYALVASVLGLGMARLPRRSACGVAGGVRTSRTRKIAATFFRQHLQTGCRCN
jgi:predicted lysophospholipase L1 biosynthesis ABC-type transport system permease subunit